MPIGICEQCGDYYQKPKDPKKDKKMCIDCFAETKEEEDAD